jgi:hypothetical protein
VERNVQSNVVSMNELDQEVVNATSCLGQMNMPRPIANDDRKIDSASTSSCGSPSRDEEEDVDDGDRGVALLLLSMVQK